LEDTFFQEDKEQLIDSSKEEYIHKYWGGKGRQIRVGDSIKFHHHRHHRHFGIVEGKVSHTTPFAFWLNGRAYYYGECTNIKVKQNGFFVDGFFPKIKF